jgi:hypothetical protein
MAMSVVLKVLLATRAVADYGESSGASVYDNLCVFAG